MTYTCATLDVPESIYMFFREKLKEAGYDHAISEDGLDMTHIMLTKQETAKPTTQKRDSMKTDDIQERVLRIVQEHACTATLPSLTARFEEDLDFDSLDVVEMSMSLEDEFAIEIPDEEAKKVVTVADVEKLVRDLLGQPG